MTPAPGSCLSLVVSPRSGVSCCSQSLRSDAVTPAGVVSPAFFPSTPATPAVGSRFPLVFLSPSLSGQMPDAGARQTGTFADACQFGAACACVARRGCPGRNAVCKFMQVLSRFACGKTFSRAREEDSNQKWHVSSLGRKLLRLMRKLQQSSETATKCCGDGKVH